MLEKQQSRTSLARPQLIPALQREALAPSPSALAVLQTGVVQLKLEALRCQDRAEAAEPQGKRGALSEQSAAAGERGEGTGTTPPPATATSCLTRGEVFGY